MLELKDDSLQQFVSEEKNVVVQFAAGWCGNCRVMKPKFKKLAGETEGFKFVLVDAEKFPESRKMTKVDNLPTFATFKDGKLVNQVQTNKYELLKDLVDEVAGN